MLRCADRIEGSNQWLGILCNFYSVAFFPLVSTLGNDIQRIRLSIVAPILSRLPGRHAMQVLYRTERSPPRYTTCLYKLVA